MDSSEAVILPFMIYRQSRPNGKARPTISIPKFFPIHYAVFIGMTRRSRLNLYSRRELAIPYLLFAHTNLTDSSALLVGGANLLHPGWRGSRPPLRWLPRQPDRSLIGVGGGRWKLGLGKPPQGLTVFSIFHCLL